MIDIFQNLRIVTNYYLKSVSLKSDFTFTHRVLVTIYYEFLLIFRKSKVSKVHDNSCYQKYIFIVIFSNNKNITNYFYYNKVNVSK